MLRIDKFNSRLTRPAGYNIHKINLSSSINSKEIKNYAKNNNLDVDLINKFRQKERDFDKQFLYT